jgi:hypothetical protein
VFGWRMLPPGRERSAWVVAGALAAALSGAFLPWHAKMLSDLDDRLVHQGAYYRDLRDVGRAPAVRAAVEACGLIATADHRPIPHLRWWLEGDPGVVAPLADRAVRARVVLLPRRTRQMRRFYRENFPTATRPAGSVPLYGNASWRVFAASGCAGR